MREKPSLTTLLAAHAGDKKAKPRRRRAEHSRARRSLQPDQGEAAAPIDGAPEKKLARALIVNRFVTELIRHNFRASPALRAVRPDVSKRSSRQVAYDLLQSQDVRDELRAQLNGLVEHAGLDESWVRSRYAAIASASIFDYVKVNPDGTIAEFLLDPEHLTPLQRACIRTLRLSAQTGRVIGIELPPLKEVVDSVARLNKLFGEVQDEVGAKQFADEITRRMQDASRRVPPPALLNESDKDEIE